MKEKVFSKKTLVVLFCIFSTIALKADSTSISYDLRISSTWVGLSKNKASDSLKQFSGNIQNTFYYNINTNYAFGIGTGFENSMFYLSDKRAFFRAYEAPVFVSFKVNSNDKKFHFFQNFGMAIPAKSLIPNISTGYYFQCGFGVGSKQLKGELAYKIISLGRDKGTLLNYNLTFGLCLTLN